jgi:hypothetical protein
VDVQLNFINASLDEANAQVAIFQKNAAAGDEELTVAWKLIQYCGQGDNHPFTCPTTMQVSASDSYGNYTPKLDAQPGDAFQVSLTNSGDMLAKSGSANSPAEVQVNNNLSQGAISAHIYKDGTLLAIKMAAFEFKPTIWIGAVSQVVQGQVMDSDIVQQVNTELSLLGVASADIVMSGGGPGQNSQPFAFTLRNIVWA